ncbi:hypothetical protein PENSPDRAFT_414316 [Peniophora sp. CONT]|nr:hypothetical protein PENSPDRAFT_414316 [Peniophora sp. CONT]
MDLPFPSMLPLESSDEPDCKLSLEDFGTLLRADDLSKLAIVSPSGIDVVTSALEHLDDALSWLDRISRNLRRRFNRLSAYEKGRRNISLPIARLPVEIFRDIFEYHVKSYEDSYVTGPLGWRILGAVCRQWRLILFDASHIWADNLEGLSVEKVHTLLALTNHAQLDLDFPEHVPLDPFYAKEKLYQLLPRAWRFSCWTSTKKSLRELLTIIESRNPLPSLRELRLYFHADMSTRMHKLLIPTMENYANLQTLCFYNLYMRPPQCGRLTSLEIEYDATVDRWATERPTLIILLEALSQNPSLQHLLLSYSVTQIDAPMSTSQRVSLPCLTSLSFYFWGSLPADILDHLWIPSLESATILWRSRERNGNATHGLQIYTSLLRAWEQPSLGILDGSLTVRFGFGTLTDLPLQQKQFALALEDVNQRTGMTHQLRATDVVPDGHQGGTCVLQREARLHSSRLL